MWYEHEGYSNVNPKTNFSNMMKRGLRQSNRVIMEDCGLTDGYMKRNVLVRISENQRIREVLVRKGDEIRVIGATVEQ